MMLQKEGSLWLSLPFFLVMIDSWWPEPNLDTYFSRMCFFSFEPETKVDRPDIGMGREGVHDWGGAAEIVQLSYLMQLSKLQG
jgi:hypothetical protein